MKNYCYFLTLLFFSICLQHSNSQSLVATSNCNSITATVSGFTNLWGTNTILGSCDESQGKCCQVIRNWSGWYKNMFGPPVLLKPVNYRLYEAGGYFVAGPQSSPTFNNIPHGTYQIRADIPIRDFCNQSPSASDPIDLYGFEPNAEPPAYYHVGYKGHLELRHSNWTIIGQTTQNDFFRNFLTAEENSGWYPTDEFCPDEEVHMHDVSANYNLYWIAIFENGGLNRWESTYWKNGTVHNNYTGPNFNLSALWRLNHPGWDFEEGLTYTVQFVIENSSCINSVKWNEKDMDFKVKSCLSPGSDDRSAIQEKDVARDVIIAPNPASSFLTIRNIDLTDNQGLKLIIHDILGKTVLESDLSSYPVDISDIPNGPYFVSIYQSENRIFSNKLIVQH